MWILLTILAAFFNALWTALSKKQLGKISPYQFTIVFRSLTALVLLPTFLYDFKISTNPIFWATVLGAGILEVLGIHAQSIGVKKDFYSTYSLSNASPIFTLIIAPQILPETVNLSLVFGVIVMVAGGFIFYQMNRKFSIYGIIRAVCVASSSILAKIAIGYSSGLTYPFLAFTFGIWFMILLNPFTHTSITRLELQPFIKRIFPLAFISAIATTSYYVAIQLAPITRVNPLIRVNIVFGFLLSYFLLKERQNVRRKIIAGILIILGAIFISVS